MLDMCMELVESTPEWAEHQPRKIKRVHCRIPTSEPCFCNRSGISIQENKGLHEWRSLVGGIDSEKASATTRAVSATRRLQKPEEAISYVGAVP